MPVKGFRPTTALRTAAAALGAGLALAAAAVPAMAVSDTTPPSAARLWNCPLPGAPGSDVGIGVSLCWDPATDDVGVTAYLVQVKRDGFFVTLETTTGRSAIVSGLVNGQSYTFRVIAKDAAGNAGPPSNELTLGAGRLSGVPPTPTPSPTPADHTPPTRPGTPEPYSAYVNGAAGLVWARSTDNVAVSTYEVYAWIDGTWTRVRAQLPPSSDDKVLAIVYDLVPGRDYLFHVLARDAAGNLSAPSDLVRQRAMVEPPIPSSPGPDTPDTTPPGTPSGLTSVSGMSIPGGIYLTWNTVSDDSGQPPRYDLFRRTAHSYAYEGENSIPRDIVSGLEPGESYTFQVVARDAAGNLSAPSAPYTAIAQSEEEPSASCAVAYTRMSWDDGFTANVKITNTGATAIDGWKLGFAFPLASQRLTNGWSATWAQTGTTVTAANHEWNKTIKPGQSLYVGFNGAHTGENPVPTAFTLNGRACTA